MLDGVASPAERLGQPDARRWPSAGRRSTYGSSVRRSRQARDAEHLARAQFEVDAAQPPARDVARLERPTGASGAPRRGAGSPGRRRRRPSSSARARGSSSATARVPTTAAAAQHGDPVGDLEDLVQAVRDVEHAGAARAEPRATIVEAGARPRRAAARRSARRGRARRGRPPSPAARRRSRRPSAPPGSPRPAAGGCRGRRRSARAAPGSRASCSRHRTRPPRPRRKPPRSARLSDRVELEDEAEILVHEAQAGGPRVGRARRRLVAVQPRDARRVGVVVAGEHLDQGRLAGPVLAHERVDLARADLQGDVVERARAGERLREVADPEHRRRARFCWVSRPSAGWRPVCGTFTRTPPSVDR